jgi:hypothetical protein
MKYENLRKVGDRILLGAAVASLSLSLTACNAPNVASQDSTPTKPIEQGPLPGYEDNSQTDSGTKPEQEQTPGRYITDNYVFNMPDGYIKDSDFSAGYNIDDSNNLVKSDVILHSYNYQYPEHVNTTDKLNIILGVDYSDNPYMLGSAYDEALGDSSSKVPKETVQAGNNTFVIYTKSSDYGDEVRIAYICSPKLNGGEPTLVCQFDFMGLTDKGRSQKEAVEKMAAKEYHEEIFNSVLANLEVR